MLPLKVIIYSVLGKKKKKYNLCVNLTVQHTKPIFILASLLYLKFHEYNTLELLLLFIVL